MSFDIVIPVGPNDLSIISSTIRYTQANVLDYRNIYLVSKNEIKLNGCIYVSEAQFPIQIEDVKKMMEKIMSIHLHREGWYYQQIIKLYAGRCIPGILENYLVLDSDVYLLKPTRFMENSVPLFATGTEYNMVYFEHMARLHPQLKKMTNASGICHHMVFTKTYLDELFQLVENKQGENPRPFWKIFLDKVSRPTPESGASEYEIYFNFMLQYHSLDMQIRNLSWMDCGSLSHAQPYHDYVAVHHWRR
jgi:hypothetical protein